LGRTSIPAQSEVADGARDQACDGERTLEDHVSRYGWDF
jgi:hypothetical protein